MPPWCPVNPYKGLFILVLIFVGLEYFFSTFTDTATTFYISSSANDSELYDNNPLLKKLLYNKNNSIYAIAAHQQQNRNNRSNHHHQHIIHSDQNHERGETWLSNIRSPSNKNSATNGTSLINTESSSSDTIVVLPSILSSPVITENNDNNDSISATKFSNANNATTTITDSLPPCPEDVSSNLIGKIPVVKTPVPTALELEKRFSWLKKGGHWQPENCKVLKKVAIVIPFRCRGEHLLLFLQHMHPFLRRQQLDYTIYVLEQDGNGPFNRAQLMNVGFVEALKDAFVSSNVSSSSSYDCFIFHDIDLLPEDDRNLYTCPEQPRHMSVAVDIFDYKLPYQTIFGGVSAITRQHFELLNGFSNSFWGWGGEDDDMSNRIRHHHLHIARYPPTIARYTMLTHKKEVPSPIRYEVLKKGQKHYDNDGLNSLKYSVVMKKYNLLYTWVLVKLEMPSKTTTSTSTTS